MKVFGEVDDGVYLGGRDAVAFLPWQECPDDCAVGTAVQVFVYSDRKGSPLATRDQPRVERGGFALLEVVHVAPHGAYLDWGLSRDLFVPMGLQRTPLEVGNRVVVTVDVDEQGRIFATTRLADAFSDAFDSLGPGDAVRLLVYGRNERGIRAVVNGRFDGMLYHNEVFRPLELGEEIEAWVKALRPDGRIDLTLQRPSRGGIEDARDILWSALVDNDGFLPLHDKSDPAQIRDRLQMSKKAFKRALGGLYRDRRITKTEEGIRIVAKTPS